MSLFRKERGRQLLQRFSLPGDTRDASRHPVSSLRSAKYVPRRPQSLSDRQGSWCRAFSFTELSKKTGGNSLYTQRAEPEGIPGRKSGRLGLPNRRILTVKDEISAINRDAGARTSRRPRRRAAEACHQTSCVLLMKPGVTPTPTPKYPFFISGRAICRQEVEILNAFRQQAGASLSSSSHLADAFSEFIRDSGVVVRAGQSVATSLQPWRRTRRRRICRAADFLDQLLHELLLFEPAYLSRRSGSGMMLRAAVIRVKLRGFHGPGHIGRQLNLGNRVHDCRGHRRVGCRDAGGTRALFPWI